jgi:hypothetical protein
LLANYVLPTTASGAGTITQAGLVATIVGTPTKTYDATTGAVLTTVNYSLSGFIGATARPSPRRSEPTPWPTPAPQR